MPWRPCAVADRLALLDARLARLDALSWISRLGPGDLHPKGLHAAPKVSAAGTGLAIVSPRLPGQNHRISKAAHPGRSRLDQDSSDENGQPCGNTFISPNYVCWVGKNVATSSDLNVQLEADPDKIEDIKSAVKHYTNSPKRILRVQARAAIQAGWDVSVHGYSESEKLSLLGLDPVDLKEIRAKAEVIENYIEKAPKYDGDVYRGLWFSATREAEDFLTGLQESHVPAVDSWSASKGVAESFSGVNEPRSVQKAAVILKQRNVHGASIKPYSALPDENEVLQPSGLKYRILAITERVEGSLARPLTVYEVDVEPVEHRPMVRKTVMDRLDQLEDRLTRLDARRKASPGQLGIDLSGGSTQGAGPGGGEPCGQSWIDPNKTCHKNGEEGKPLHPLFQEAMARRQANAVAAAAAQAKAAKSKSAPGLQLGQDDQGRLLVNGKPAKQLSKGNYGDTFKVDTPDGPVLVKVDRLNGGDPQEDDPGVSREQQRLNMANREHDNLKRAAAIGVGPEPIGEVVKLPADGRFAIAYRMVEGAPLKASFSSTEPDTAEAAAILAKPGARERLDAGVLRLARVMADAGLEHGDLHGANIVVQPDGSPMLIDWGIGGQDPPGAAANRAQLEARMLLQMNYYTQTLNRHGGGPEEVAEGLAKRMDRSFAAMRAADDLQRKYDTEWEEENLSPDDWMPRMREASRLRKQGMSSDAAQRQAGVLPKITPQMKKATDQARNALFGDTDLLEMRRWVDQQVMGAGR